MAGVIQRSFPLFLVGMFLFGFGQASSLLGRFAAADVSTADQRGRAIGLIVGGATAGSIIGPNLLARRPCWRRCSGYRWWAARS